MLELTKRLSAGVPEKTLTLALEQRKRSRLRVMLDDGTPAGLFLDRGPVLRDGDLIASEEGVVVGIKAAAETVSRVSCDDPLLLARACYHLGNRHVPLEIGDRFLRYQHDHVLDEMLRGIGLQPRVEHQPFQPEPGAYSGHAPDHGRQYHHVHDDHAH